MTNQDYKNAALEALKGKWAPTLVATIIFFIFAAMVSGVSVANNFITLDENTLLFLSGGSLLYSLLFYYPLSIGYYGAMKNLLNSGDERVTANMFSLGFTGWFRNVWGMFIMALKVFLWTLLLFIPGIIMSFAYAMTPFILKDNPEISAAKASKLSREMMKGHKFDLFYLWLSFIGWLLLGILTLCIGYIWLIPYITASTASFYEDVKAQYLLKQAQQDTTTTE